MKKYIGFFLFLVLFCVNNVFAYEETTVHPEITANALNTSNTIDFLKKSLKVDLVLNENKAKLVERFRGNKFLERTITGSTDEDMGKRSLNHFYDPTNGRGLHIPGTLIQSPVWMNNSYSWAYNSSANDKNFYNTLDKFENSMTASFKANRETSIKEMLYCLGHLVHLIEDCAVPAHVRNDKHLYDTKNKVIDFFYNDEHDRDFYEAYTYDEIRYSRWPDYTSYGVVDITNFDKMSKFWDWNKGGAGESAEGVYDDNSKGLAEFTNHNFVSKDTNIGNIFDRIYRMNMMEIV